MGGDFLKYASYVLDRSQFCFLVVQGELSEDYAIDIFNTFNSTGEPLTAFEMLKSRIYKKTQKEKIADRLNKVETSLSNMKMKKNKQNKYTDRLLLFLSMMHEELNTDKFTSLRDKRVILDKISNEMEDKIPDYIDSICDIHNFIIENNWEKANGKSIFTTGEAAVCFEFLKSIAHDRVIPILFKFAENRERDEVVKACAAFSCLWRGVAADAGTDRIDNQYKNITEALFREGYDAAGLRNELRKCLLKKWKNRDMTRGEWIKEFADINIYKRIKFTRFVLFVAFHKMHFDPETQAFVKSKLKFLTIQNYEEYDYKSIEHIVPQSYKTINRIGNLVLLPQKINAKAGKENFVSKRRIYEQCLERKDTGDGMPYLEILREVISYGDSYLDKNNHLNDEAIKKRGERLGHAVWETLAEDWLGWTDG